MLVSDISAFKMKIMPFISPLKYKNCSKFPQLKERIECADDLDYFTEYIDYKPYKCMRPLRVVPSDLLRKKIVYLHL